MAATVAAVVAKQDEVYGSISRAVTNMKKLEVKKRTPEHIQTRLEILEANWKKFQNHHEMIMTLKPEERKLLSYVVDETYAGCEEAYADAKGEMLAFLNELRRQAGEIPGRQAGPQATHGALGSRQLPRINLPSFSGSYREWRRFQDLFKSMVGSNPEIPAVEKMHYLTTSVTGEAAQLIVNFDVTGDNFDRAWRVIVDRYENKRVLIDTRLSSIFAIQKMSQQSAAELKTVLGDVKEALGALKLLGCPTESWDYIIVYMITRKLDSDSLIDWEKQVGATTELPTFAELEKFILGRIHALEAVARATSETEKPRAPAPTASKGQPSAKSHQASASQTEENASTSNVNPGAPKSGVACPLCGAAHYLSMCQEYRGKTVEQRHEIVKQKNLCFNCLGAHQFRNCKSAARCRVCSSPHHTTIHRATNSTDGSPSEQTPPADAAAQRSQAGAVAPGSQPHASALPCREETPAGPSTSTHVALTTAWEYTPVLLATALVKVTSCYGEEHEVRALLDQGSEVSFMTESLAQRLNLPRERVSLPINGIGGQRSSVSRGIVSIDVVSRVDSAFTLQVNAYVLAKLTSYLPPVRVVQNPWSHLQGLELADPGFSSATQIDLILGADVYGLILEDGLRRGGPGSPIAQRTALGWILSGSVAAESSCNVASRAAQGLQCSVDRDLLDLVQRFWVQEETTGPTNRTATEEESQCEQHFSETHARTPGGRYIVRIPLKRLPEELGDSYRAALFALSRQEKRFKTDITLKAAYSKFMAEYEALGHMSRVPDAAAAPRTVFYLPHHAVVRESSTTTKVRVVFNGSYRTSGGVSVNDLQHVGPKLQTDLADVITRWRRYLYVFAADIEKMYRQVRIHEGDRDLQRILWREHQDSPPLSYRLNTVTYGLASAPYLAIRALRQLAVDEKERFPLAVEVIQREVYVDDVLSGADGIAEAQEKIRQVDECLKSGCFPLQKWAANEEQLLASIPEERRGSSPSVSFESDPLFRALGLLWQPRGDAFVFASLGQEPLSRVSKRGVLSRVAQLFDPLGWIAPVVVRGKIFIQELWAAKLGWDEPVPEEVANRWKSFEEDLQLISELSVPRWLGSRASALAVEVHGFSDASQAALGAVIYLRVLNDLDDVRVTLVAAKTRVAPLKQVTIPRLELSAAHLLVRQVSHVRDTLDLNDAPIHLWTDSTVALAYIRGDARRWADYVRNRVTDIQELKNSHWHHVPGKENPADCASRGLSPRQLKHETLWWSGPAWLSQHSAAWPAVIPSPDADVALEVRKAPVNIATKDESLGMWELVERFSSLRTLLRVTSWCFRAARKFQREKNAANRSSPLTPEEIEIARLFWVKGTQLAYFKGELDLLARGKQIPRSSALLRLAPFVDAGGLLRVGGRLRNTLLDHDEKHPVILPRDSAITTLVIADVHQRTLYGGTQITLSTLRRRYWVVGGRVPIRAFIHRCVQCVRYRAALRQQRMGQLPESRVNRARPFLNSGVDYAGPLTLRTFRGRGAKSYKGYIVVFVCLSTSAVHLELATDYTTEGFLAAYKRFTSRRGICRTLASDCGTNFIGADKELRKLFQASSEEFVALANCLASDGTLWKFNPPSAPHFGGKWEAAVKSVKFHLKRVIGDTSLTYEEFSTFLSQVEAVLNSRPLCPLSDDPTDLSALTPGHFLTGAALNTIPEPTLIDLPSSRLSRWQLIRQLLEKFWQRWSTEYLQQLQTITKWQHQFNSLKVGSLVLVKDERYPPSKWALGRVIDVHPGKDNLVRVATVQTQQSVFKRPIVKLVLLPISTNEDDT